MPALNASYSWVGAAGGLRCVQIVPASKQRAAHMRKLLGISYRDSECSSVHHVHMIRS
jgi:hypothetical protein